MSSDILFDPIENNPEIKLRVEQARIEAETNLIKIKDTLGFCHELWREQKRILKEKFKINWKTPDEMNPGWRFD